MTDCRSVVRQDQLWLVRQRAGNGGTLLLAGRKLAWVMMQTVAQTDAFQQIFCKWLVHACAERHAEQNIFQAGVACSKLKV